MSKKNARKTSQTGRAGAASKLEADLKAGHEKLQQGHLAKAEQLLESVMSISSAMRIG